MNSGQGIVVCLLQILVLCQGFIVDCGSLDALCVSATPKLQLFYDDLNTSLPCNIELTISKTANPPDIKFPQGEGQSFVLVVSDPDIPIACASPHVTYLHGLVLAAVHNGQLMVSSDIFAYVGPHPRAGIHRYQYRLFPLSTPTAAIKHTNQRRGFNLDKFKTDNNLTAPSAVFQLRVPAV